MKKLLCLLLVLTTFNLFAQNAAVREQMRNSTPIRNVNDISTDNIRFWVGSGNQEVVAAFFACGPSPVGGVAYGFRFNGTATIQDMLDAIQLADPNFSYNASSGFIEDVVYNGDSINYEIPYGMMMYTLNGSYASGLFDPLSNGDYFELSEFGDCDIPNDNIFYPEDPNASSLPEDAVINEEDITYWVGNGNNKVVLAVNWCNTDIAMAWGVRFDGDSALVSDLMHTISLYDSRFNYTYSSGMMNDITFQDGTYNLALHGNWWMYNINGVGAMNSFDAQYVHNGDLIKWGDESCGTADENYNYAWTTTIQPVSTPVLSTEIFDGIVGSEGCQAIRFDDQGILSWATACSIVRGVQNVASDNGLLASYGDESAGIGASSISTADAVSLGDGGTATLTFDQPITNGDGYDFAVFENALNDTFLELAFVEVSSDGVHFYRFPPVSNTPTEVQIGNGGSVDATQLKNLAGKYQVGWGTPFDLAELDGYSNLDINNVTHVRLVDVVGTIDPQFGTTDKNGHIINDPYPTPFASSGFDLTGVAVMNGWSPSTTSINTHTANQPLVAYPNPCTNSTTLYNLEENESVKIYNTFGQLLQHEQSHGGTMHINMQNQPAGLYIIKVGNKICKLMKK